MFLVIIRDILSRLEISSTSRHSALLIYYWIDLTSVLALAIKRTIMHRLSQDVYEFLAD